MFAYWHMMPVFGATTDLAALLHADRGGQRPPRRRGRGPTAGIGNRPDGFDNRSAQFSAQIGGSNRSAIGGASARCGGRKPKC